MVNEDILTSLKNGLQRNQPLEEVVQTLNNSGYNSQEIQEAVNIIQASSISVNQNNSQLPEINHNSTTTKDVDAGEIQSNKISEKKSSKGIVILTIIIIILLILAGVLIFGSKFILDTFFK